MSINIYKIDLIATGISLCEGSSVYISETSEADRARFEKKISGRQAVPLKILLRYRIVKEGANLYQSQREL